MTIWGIHNDESSLDLLSGGFISVGWDEVGDLRQIGNDRDLMKRVVSRVFPEAKPGAIPVWAGVLLRFGFQMQPGDVVISPSKADRTINFGEVASEYEFQTDAPLHKHRRRVTWVRTGVPRTTFTQKALYEIGSAITMFRVANYAQEFQDFLSSRSETEFVERSVESSEDAEIAAEWASDEPNVGRLSEYTRDFIINTLMRTLDHEEFEHFVAAVLSALGYQSRVTPFSGDGGVDVIAHRDPLGLEPPLIKIQCKHTSASAGAPEVQQLVGTLSSGELGLFVTLGSFTRDAKSLERVRQDLRLVGGAELVDLILECYDALEPRWKRHIPLRKLYVVDREVAP